MSVVDLFAGPGGWDVAASAHGIEPLGIEWDDAACATREAAGLRTLQADVASLDPMDFAPCVGLIGSPPCQAFSMAGKGEGRGAMEAYRWAIEVMARRGVVDVEALDRASGDPRGHLVLEPLRWALVLRPRWIALEQVEPVLPLWEAMAGVLRQEGYAVWTGVLTAERYGVPQTRRRAILLASLDGPVSEPVATHARYIAPRRREEDTLDLFAAPEPERIVRPEDRGLLPWVSMAEALGWGMTARPSVTYTASAERYGAKPLGSGSGAQRTLDRAREEGAWAPQDQVGFPRRNDLDDGGEYRERDLRAASEPAFALTEKARSWQRWVVETNNYSAKVRDADGGRSKAGSEPFTRSVHAPSPSVTSGTKSWITHWNPRQAPARSRSIEDPAPTILAEGLAHGVPVWDRGKELLDTTAQDARAVRVTLEEALVLQSFPADYPVQGTKTKRFEQVGNAIPPLLAWHALRAVLPARLEAAA